MMRGKKELLVGGWFSRESVLCPVSGLLRCLTHFNFGIDSLPPDQLKTPFFLTHSDDMWVAISFNQTKDKLLNEYTFPDHTTWFIVLMC